MLTKHNAWMTGKMMLGLLLWWQYLSLHVVHLFWLHPVGGSYFSHGLLHPLFDWFCKGFFSLLLSFWLIPFCLVYYSWVVCTQFHGLLKPTTSICIFFWGGGQERGHNTQHLSHPFELYVLASLCFCLRCNCWHLLVPLDNMLCNLFLNERP